MSMKRIGLTGMSGSGKSYLCKIFEKYGLVSVNSDSLVHVLYSGKNPCTEKLATLFGNAILNTDHSINRPKLAEVVFADPEQLALLNRTVHPFVIDKIEAMAKDYERMGVPAFVIEAPQPFEAGIDRTCDLVISVIADHKTCISRITERDGLSLERAEKRLANQHDETFFREHADFCIDNSHGEDPEKQIRLILSDLGLLT